MSCALPRAVKKMAIYHLSAQVISRGTGGNALAAAAYRSGEKIGEFDYSIRERTVDYTNILAPENAPKWCFARDKLWAAVEASEKRKDAQLCREFNLALPVELKRDEQKNLLNSFAADFVQRGMVADIVIHNQGGGNPHAHIMLTTRELTKDGFGKKRREWNRRELLQEWRQLWADLTNAALSRAGHDARIDHRTLVAQGIDRMPTMHEGKNVRHQLPKKSIIHKINTEINTYNDSQNDIKQIERELDEIKKNENIYDEKYIQEGKERVREMYKEWKNEMKRKQAEKEKQKIEEYYKQCLTHRPRRGR